VNLLKSVGSVLAVAVVLLVGLYLAGFIGPPSASIADEGDWGTVSQDRTEVVTTLAVENPNPLGISIGERLSAAYRVSMNDVRVASGEQTGLEVPSGTSRMELSTYIDNDRIPPWWVAFVRADETLRVNLTGEIRATAFGLSSSTAFPAQERTMLENETPIIASMSEAIGELEGTYTTEETVGTEPVTETVTVGYEVERAWATWGTVNRSSTEVLFHVRLHNPSERIPVPAAPDGLTSTIEMNDVALVDVEGEGVGVRNLDRDAVIPPGETREVVYVAVMDNEQVDDWFRRHVERGERSNVEVRTSLLFDVPRTGTTIRVPEDGPVTVMCAFQTAMLVDDQETATTCGAPGA
jgi:LEA14-like dessication related protein